MKKSTRSVKEILQHLYEDRKKERGAKYSLRAYSYDLGISSGRLMAFLQQTNLPSAKTVEKIATRLKLSPQKLSELQKAVDTDKKNRLIEKADLVLKKEDLHIVVDWIPFAIISLLMIDDFELSTENVSHRLGISVDVANQTIKKLKSMNLIVEKNHRWVPQQRKIATEMDIPSEMIRASHKDKMKLTTQRMEQVQVDMRDYSSITFPIDPENLPLAKKMITEFRRNLAETMGRGRPSEVYSLNLQLFPLSRSEKTEI